MGGDGFGTTGGELAYDLDYYIEDYSEAMHEAPAVEQPVDLEKVKFWVGEGEKSATVVFQFNDGKGPENLVYGYRWSGGWDDNLQTVIAKYRQSRSAPYGHGQRQRTARLNLILTATVRLATRPTTADLKVNGDAM